MTPAAQLSASQIKGRIERMMIRHQYRCDYEELHAVHEAIRRVEEHELLMRNVLPEIQNRLTELEAVAANESGTRERAPRARKKVRQDRPHLPTAPRPVGFSQPA
jgi:hypothetical protein